MTDTTYSIFGAGASGLYTAWRLLNGSPTTEAGTARQLGAGDTLQLFDWGNYDFSGTDRHLREAGARVCTWHYQDDPTQSYLEMGGMRFARWDTAAPDHNDGSAPGHRLVTKVISDVGLDPQVVPFNESTDPLYLLRSENFYFSGISSRHPAPYNASGFGATSAPDDGFTVLQDLAPSTESTEYTRAQWMNFYRTGSIEVDLPGNSVFQKGDLLTDVGYWNLMYDRLGAEGYNYAADGNGYSSNVINWNAAVAFQSNNEFTPGTNYFTLTTGFSGMFAALFQSIAELAAERNVDFSYIPDTRLHSIQVRDEVIEYTLATRDAPWKVSETATTDAAWMAMPRHALELVAQGSRYSDDGDAVDVLNAERVQLYREAAIMQPSYKIGMFFATPWWESATYPAKVEAYVVTTSVIAALPTDQFPEAVRTALGSAKILNKSFASPASLLDAVAHAAEQRLDVVAQDTLLVASRRNTIGPSVTDTPIRQTVYFGDNATGPHGPTAAYGMLVSYDDERFTSFWQELELEPDQQRTRPRSDDTQTLDGPRTVPDRMVKMLRRQLAELHYGPGADFTRVPEPLEAKYMDWSLPPFNAGYHAWSAHYDIADVQQSIRKPTQLIDDVDADLFIVGEAYSNDQAWVEGAYCTAESVLNDFFDIAPLIDNTNYPFIIPAD